jgi:hypothetical protein
MRIGWLFIYLATLFYIGVVVAIVALYVAFCLVRLAWDEIWRW